MAPRKYDQRLRAESAEETRSNVLEAVYQQLREAPAKPVSVEDVARTAGVSRSTVYLIFGSRAGLFEALTTDLWWNRAGFRQVVEAVEHPDAREHMRGGITAGVLMFAAHGDVFRALFSMGRLDPEAVGGAIATVERDRAGGMDHLAGRLAEQAALRRDVTTDQAANLLWLLSSFDSFDQLFTGRGLPVEAVTSTLVSTAERSLLR